jgi:CubicO group peptidase (beta-lactamase class C family)
MNPGRKNFLKSCLVFLVFFFLFVFTSNAKYLEEKFARVDRLFSSWDNPHTPGCALAVIQNGKIIFKKGYGLANLDHDVKITTNTVFRTGSVSKQFTAACIQILHKEGKLSLDDNIRKYVSQMPEYDWPITIRHLIHHISGIREYEWLQYFGGEHSNQAEHDNDDIIELIARQKNLEFKPGDKYSYSNSGYTLLATIVESISGKPFSQFVKERIFDPLGMKNSLVYDDNTMIIKNRATGYSKGDNGYVVNETLNESTGDGGVFTTVEDFFLWDQNFYEDKIGGSGFMKSLLQVGKLNDGTPAAYEHNGATYKYAYGLAISRYKGLRTVSHGGAYVGFRAAYLQFPDQQFSIICLGNQTCVIPMELCYQIADIFLGGCFTEKTNPFPRKTSSAENTKNERTNLTNEQLHAYVGKYYSEELQVFYTIGVKNRHLIFTHANPPTASLLSADGPDVFSFSGYEMKFIRNTTGEVIGFTFQSGKSVKNIFFEKMH